MNNIRIILKTLKTKYFTVDKCVIVYLSLSTVNINFVMSY